MKNKILGVIATVAIIVMASCASLTIVSVDWDSLKGPAKVRQYFSVSTTDVSVYANYKDDSRKEVVFFSTSHDKDSIGMQTVTVTVLGFQGTGTFQTEVMELLSIRVDRAPSKTSYNVGERADLAGIKVMGSWRDLPDAEVPAYQVEVAGFDSGSAGNNRLVTVNFKGKRATFPVTVVVPAAPSTPAPSAPAASQPSQPAQQQPSTQQPSQPPAQNQPSPVGTWRQNRTDSLSVSYTFNANGTGTYRVDTSSTPFTWTASGNKLTAIVDLGGGNLDTSVFTYSISGNTLSLQLGTGSIQTFTRQ